jgi:hypothetical protein
MENKYYIYAHVRKDKNSIFYIGKGSGKRAYIKSNRSNYWKKIVEKHGYDVLILLENLTEEESFKYEIMYIEIEKRKGNCEANFTKGGDGVVVDKRWWNEKISKSLKGIKRPSGKENKNYKNIITKEDLYDLYVVKNLNTIKISKIYNVSIPTITARLKEYNIEKRNSGRKTVKIKCIEDNLEFNSLSEASKYYCIHRENIAKVLKGIYKKTGNKTFIKLS